MTAAPGRRRLLALLSLLGAWAAASLWWSLTQAWRQVATSASPASATMVLVVESSILALRHPTRLPSPRWCPQRCLVRFRTSFFKPYVSTGGLGRYTPLPRQRSEIYPIAKKWEKMRFLPN